MIVSFLVSCENSEEVIKNNYYLSLSGESKNWEVDSYEVVIKPDTFSAGNGKLTMKNDKEVTSHFF
ncbi:hypothetical protein [Piscibacillus salipiscarius]|uniref:hypothetical protein n=1 Tax=Piscibacillus salipiscarius TaxID=299480 RepID=UPI002436B0AE|nr:hypothetical protein [Piscibacillus salipiscarius]